MNYFTMFDILFLKKYSQIILDLDDTLIYEKDYLYSAYQSISDKLGENEIDSQEMFLYLKNNFDLGLRKNLFNSFIIAFDLSPLVLQCMLEELRNCIVVGGLNLTKEGAIILDYIKKLKKEYLIITNGNPIQQANKIKQINWDNHLQPSKVVYANEYKPKPCPEVFFALSNLKSFGKVLYIGDSEVDREFAINSGVDYYLI
jgi:FMN phosphatase YigB (HAD superfamily)